MGAALQASGIRDESLDALIERARQGYPATKYREGPVGKGFNETIEHVLKIGGLSLQNDDVGMSDYKSRSRQEGSGNEGDPEHEQVHGVREATRGAAVL